MAVSEGTTLGTLYKVNVSLTLNETQKSIHFMTQTEEAQTLLTFPRYIYIYLSLVGVEEGISCVDL
jgi:hypothetical protein